MMKNLLLVLVFLFSSSLYAFTVLTNPPVRFPKSEITVNVSSDNCTNTGFTNAKLLTLVNDSIEKYWNKVSTSSIKFKKGAVIGTSIKSETATSDILDLVSIGTILIGCNDQLFSDAFTGAIGSIQSSSVGVVGSVAINDSALTNVDTYTQTELLALVAHELGHAVGIGHSGDSVALMHYSLSGKYQEYLTQDDKDAITFLYPNHKEAGGFLGSCGTISDISGGSDDNNHNSPGQFLALFIVGIFISIPLRKLFARL